jgi:hypothetical protein
MITAFSSSRKAREQGYNYDVIEFDSKHEMQLSITYRDFNTNKAIDAAYFRTPKHHILSRKSRHLQLKDRTEHLKEDVVLIRRPPIKYNNGGY